MAGAEENDEMFKAMLDSVKEQYGQHERIRCIYDAYVREMSFDEFWEAFWDEMIVSKIQQKLRNQE